jgi:CRP/FNR family transcriptional regulator, cyclic AMP receptor protein
MRSRKEGSRSAPARPAQHGLQKTGPVVRVGPFLSLSGKGKVVVALKKNQTLFLQGEAGDSVFYIRKGRVRFTFTSKQGKEATIALLSPGDFVGHECIAVGHPFRMATAVAITDAEVLKIEKQEMIRALHEDDAFSDCFGAFLLDRSIRIQADLVDQLFNSSEKRLARLLLLLAQYGKQEKPAIVIPKISQETLATMIGTTRGRVNYFMNRFRKLGFIHYDGEVKVNSSLLNVILHD